MMYPDFVDSYISWLKTKITTKEIDDYLEITTPFLDRHNDHLQIYVKKAGDKYLLTDDGYILNDLAMSGVDLKPDRRQKMLHIMLNKYGIALDGSELTVFTSLTDFPKRKHSLIQAMLNIDDMFLVSQHNVKGFFVEDIEEFFKDKEIRYVPDIQFTGKSGFSHSYDFAIPASKQKPERLIKAVNNPTREKAESLIFAWNDTREARKNISNMYAFLNDSKKVSPAISTALREYEITPVLWSERQGFVHDLVA